MASHAGVGHFDLAFEKCYTEFGFSRFPIARSCRGQTHLNQPAEDYIYNQCHTPSHQATPNDDVLCVDAHPKRAFPAGEQLVQISSPVGEKGRNAKRGGNSARRRRR